MMDHRDEPWTYSTSSAKERPTIPSLHFTSPDASHEIRGRRSLTRGTVITACRYEILTDTSPRLLPFGRWRYSRAPQGFLSSGDGYNRRFDAILAGFDRKERIVDDTIFHDEDWWRTIDFLSTVGQAGVVLNPNKFQFASREVDFSGFRITDARNRPTAKVLQCHRRLSHSNIYDGHSKLVWIGQPGCKLRPAAPTYGTVSPISLSAPPISMDPRIR